MQNMQNIQKNQENNTNEPEVHEVIQTMTNFMNYLAVSLYETQFTKNHEDSYATLKSIYEFVTAQPSVPPSHRDVKQFYDNIVYLGNVTYTEDPDYYKYKMILRKYALTTPTLLAKNVPNK
jgi:hypothetical protein